MVDPPLRKGQTHYPYLVFFFESDGSEDDTQEVSLSPPAFSLPLSLLLSCSRLLVWRNVS